MKSVFIEREFSVKNSTCSKKMIGEIMFVLACIFVVCIYDNLLTTTYSDKSIGTFFNAVIVIVSAIYFLFDSISKKQISKSIIVCFVVIYSIVLSTILNDSNLSAAATKSGIFLFAAVFASNHSIEEFASKNRIIVCVISLFTLFINLLYITGVDLSFLPLVSNTKGTLFYIGVLGNVHANSSSILRLSGIWWEPGVYAAYIVASISLELYVSKKISIFYIAVLILSLVLTFSTTGYVALVVLLISYLFSFKKKKRIFPYLMVICGLVATVIIVYTNSDVRELLFSKIFERDESFKDRFYSIFGNFVVIGKSPIFGMGTIKSSEIITEYMIANGSTRSFSNLNTPLAYFAVFGFLPGLYFITKVFGFVNCLGNSKIQKVLLLLSFLLILISTNYLFSLFFTALFFLRRRYSKK